MEQGKYTVETFARAHHLTRQSSINKLSKLKYKGYVSVSGGGAQKRIYTVSKLPKRPTNGFYDLVNKYSPEKLVPLFDHYVYGTYTVEHAIVDGLNLGDIRTKEAVMHLFRHVTDWKRLILIAKSNNKLSELHKLYNQARKKTKCKTMPKRYRL